jgi:hypothetical protein
MYSVWVLNVVLIIRKKTHTIRSYIFWNKTLCSQSKVNGNFGGICRLHLQGISAFTLDFSSSYFSTVKAEEMYSSETSVKFQPESLSSSPG